MALTISPCRKVCTWDRTGETYDGLALFACAGCGTEWVRSEPWTPREWDGGVPAAVRAERAAGAADNADS